MNRQDLIKILSRESSLSLKKSNEVVSSIIKIICTGLYCGEEVRISRFGTFWVKYYEQSVICNKNSTLTHKIPARFVPKFRCSKALKKRFLMPEG